MKNYITVMLGLFVISCHHANAPQVDNGTKTVLDIQFEIVSGTNIPPSFDSSFYQHDESWHANGFYDTTAADSFASVLKFSGLSVTDFWFPNTAKICGNPIGFGSNAIVKLEPDDTAAHNFGLRRIVDQFPIRCFRVWRHYKYVKVPAAP